MQQFLSHKADAPVGEGAMWSADGQTANRLQDGEEVEEISLEEARQIAARVGVPAPFGGGSAPAEAGLAA